MNEQQVLENTIKRVEKLLGKRIGGSKTAAIFRAGPFVMHVQNMGSVETILELGDRQFGFGGDYLDHMTEKDWRPWSEKTIKIAEFLAMKREPVTEEEWTRKGRYVGGKLKFPLASGTAIIFGLKNNVLPLFKTKKEVEHQL